VGGHKGGKRRLGEAEREREKVDAGYKKKISLISLKQIERKVRLYCLKNQHLVEGREKKKQNKVQPSTGKPNRDPEIEPLGHKKKLPGEGRASGTE